MGTEDNKDYLQYAHDPNAGRRQVALAWLWTGYSICIAWPIGVAVWALHMILTYPPSRFPIPIFQYVSTTLFLLYIPICWILIRWPLPWMRRLDATALYLRERLILWMSPAMAAHFAFSLWQGSRQWYWAAAGALAVASIAPTFPRASRLWPINAAQSAPNDPDEISRIYKQRILSLWVTWSLALATTITFNGYIAFFIGPSTRLLPPSPYVEPVWIGWLVLCVGGGLLARIALLYHLKRRRSEHLPATYYWMTVSCWGLLVLTLHGTLILWLLGYFTWQVYAAIPLLGTIAITYPRWRMLVRDILSPSKGTPDGP